MASLPIAATSVALMAAPVQADEGLPESQLVDALGDCIVREQPGLAWQLMRSSVGSSVEHSLLVTIAERAQKCMQTGKLSIPAWAFRGTIAGAKMRADGEIVAARHLPVVHPGRAESSRNNGVLARRFAACVAAEAPGEVGDLIATPLATAAAELTVQSLAPAMSACIPEAVELHILPPELRIDLAEALYERLHGAATPSTAEKRTN